MATFAAGVIVEEMLEELVSPLVDGRTKGEVDPLLYSLCSIVLLYLI